MEFFFSREVSGIAYLSDALAIVHREGGGEITFKRREAVYNSHNREATVNAMSALVMGYFGNDP